MRPCNCLFKEQEWAWRNVKQGGQPSLIFHSIWITLAMQSKDSTAKVNILDIYVYTTAFSVLIVFTPSVCFQLKSIFYSMTRCFTLWCHFVTLFLCPKISVFTPMLMLFTFSFFFFLHLWYHKLLPTHCSSHEVDFPFLSLDFITCKVSLLNVFIFLMPVNDCSFTIPV